MALADTASLIVNLNLKGNFGSQLGRASRQLNTFDARLAKSESRAFRVGQHIGTGIKNLGRLAVAGAAAVGSIAVASLKLAGDFEAQLNTINTIARETPAGLSKIGAQIREIARDTGTPLEELTQGYYDLLSAGIKAADAQKVLIAANRLAIGGLGTTAETVDLLTTALNTYGLKASLAAKVSDIFAKAIERGKVTASQLAGAFSDIGPIAAASGIEISEVAAAFARLTASGVPAAEAATQMRSAIVALTRRTPELKKLEKQTHRNYLAIASKKGLVYALQLMRTDAKKAGVPLIELLGRVEGLNFTLATTGPNFEKYNEDLAAMRKATGTSAAQMAEREKGLNFQLERLRALAHDAGITIGNVLLPKITPLFEKLNKFINLPDTQKAIGDFGTALADLFSDENINAGIELLKDGLTTAKEVAPIVAESARVTGAAISAAVTAFKTLPKEVQALAIGALAVNKLTGGIVTTLGKGIFEQLFARGSNPANPMWVATVTGGLGTPGAPGGPPGAPPGGPPGAPSGAITPAIGAGIAITDTHALYEWGRTFVKDFKTGGSTVADGIETALKGVPGTGPANKPPGHDLLTPAEFAAKNKDSIAGLITPLGDLGVTAGQIRTAVDTKGDASKNAIDLTRIAVDKVPTSIQAGASSVVGKLQDVVGTIIANRPNISVNVAVQATQVTKTVTIQERYGPGNGSYGGGH